MSAADELRNLDAAATSGPWIPDFDDDYPSPLRAGEDVLGVPVICYGPPHTDPADLALIATLRNALPEIIAVVEAAQAPVEGTFLLDDGKDGELFAMPLAMWMDIRRSLTALNAKLNDGDEQAT